MTTCLCGCGGEIVPQKHHRWKGTPKYISGHNMLKGKNSLRYKNGYTINNGYIRITCGDNNRRYEHDVVMEEFLGRKLGIHELVHHINGVKTDNKLGNLELTTFSGHQHIHPKERRTNGTFASRQDQEF